jgi:DNA-binding transcriptional regulator YiaG
MPSQPYVARLPNGRYSAVELPEASTETDSTTGELILLPPAIHLLDRLRILLSPLPEKSTPGRIKTLRESLGLSPNELADQLQVDASLVGDWEKGKSKPSAEHLSILERLRQRGATRNSVA